MASVNKSTYFPTMTLIRWVVVGLVIFFPLVNIGGFPLVLPLLVAFLIFRYDVPTMYIYAGVLGSAIVGVVTISNVYIADVVAAEDMFYWIMPLFYVIFIAIGIAIFSGDGYRRSHIALKLFLVVQVVAISVQLVNPLGIVHQLEVYFQTLSVNLGATTAHGSAEVLQRRPSGTTGMSTRVGFVAYLFGRFLTIYTNRYRYVVLAGLLALASSSRMALITIVITEIIVLGLPILRSREAEIHVRTLILMALPTAVVGLVLAAYHPFLGRFIDAAVSGDLVQTILSTHSIQHRSQSYSYLINNPEYIVTGGLVSTEFHTFAYDSELVLRTLQFGFVGYLAFKLPLVACWLRGVQQSDTRLRRLGAVLVLVSLFSSLTMTTSSNMYFILLYGILIAAGETSSFADESVTSK